MKKLKEFVKEHKKELAIGAGCLVVGGVVFFITKKKPKILSEGLLTDAHLPKLTKLDVTESLASSGVYEISSTNPNRYLDVWMKNTPLSKLGEVGEEIAKIPGVDAERGFTGVVDLYIKNGD